MRSPLRAVIFSALLASLAVACKNGETRCDDAVDDDADGWVDCFDQDCVDTCGELCGNLLDDNGDGTVDCADPLCTEACLTQSGSGPEACTNGEDEDGDWLIDCQDPDCDGQCDADGDSWLGTAVGGPDCDDTDANVHPGVEEVAYDAVDNDCDAATPDDDLDGDGFLVADDCGGAADTDPHTYPEAPEVCGDGVLNDCTSPAVPARADCFGERDAWSADGILYGSVGAGLAGFSVSSAGDVDGDGYGDLVVGAYGDGDDNTGAAYFVRGPLEGDADLTAVAGHKWLGESGDSWAGVAVAGGADLTGDGVSDLAIGAQYDDQGGNNAGAVVVVSAIDDGLTTALADEERKVVGSLQYDYAGTSLAIPGDVNGDGWADLLVGAPNNTGFFTSGGAAQLVYGPITGPVELSRADWEVLGEKTDDNAGCAVAGAGDLDGDGLGDVLVGVCLNDRGGADGGFAVQYSNLVSGPFHLAEADGALVAEASNDNLGKALAGGDTDGDGRSDVLVGAPSHDGNGEDSGAVYVCSGPATVSMNRPDAKLVGESAGDKAGQSVAVIGDVDGDSYGDIAVGAPSSDLGGEDAGSAYLLFGPVDGEIDLAEADVRIVGSAAFDFVGQSVAAGGDVDQDGFPDLFVGAPYNDTLNSAAGAAYLFTFGW